MLKYNWMIPGSTLETAHGSRLAIHLRCYSKSFHAREAFILKGRRFINGVATKNNEKEKSLC